MFLKKINLWIFYVWHRFLNFELQPRFQTKGQLWAVKKFQNESNKTKSEPNWLLLLLSVTSDMKWGLTRLYKYRQAKVKNDGNDKIDKTDIDNKVLPSIKFKDTAVGRHLVVTREWTLRLISGTSRGLGRHHDKQSFAADVWPPGTERWISERLRTWLRIKLDCLSVTTLTGRVGISGLV